MAFLIALTVCLAFVLWLSAFRLQVKDGMLSYRSLLNGVRSIALSDIGGVETRVRPSEPFGPFVQLVIIPSSQPPDRAIVVNMKVFSRKDIRSLYDVLQRSNIPVAQ